MYHPSSQVELVIYALGAFVLGTAIERSARWAFPALLPPEKGGLLGPRRAAHPRRSKDD